MTTPLSPYTYPIVMMTVGAPRTCGVSWANKAWPRPSLSKLGLGLKFPSSRWASEQG